MYEVKSLVWKPDEAQNSDPAENINLYQAEINIGNCLQLIYNIEEEKDSGRCCAYFCDIFDNFQTIGEYKSLAAAKRACAKWYRIQFNTIIEALMERVKQ